MDAQAGLRLCCSHPPDDRFSCIVVHIFSAIKIVDSPSKLTLSICELEIEFVKRRAPNHMLVQKDGALFKTRVILSLKLLAILLTIFYQLTKLGWFCCY